MKLRVNPKYNNDFEALLKRYQIEIQKLGDKMKMSGSEHVQSKDLAQVEEENDILAKDLIDRNNEILALKQQEAKLKKRIDSNICVVIMVEYPQNATKKHTKTLTELHLSEGELKRVQNDLDATQKILRQKEKNLEYAKTNVEIIGKNLQETNHEIFEMKENMKGNMSHLQAKQLVWNEIIEDIKNHQKYITLMDEKRIIIEDYEGFILSAKEEGENNSYISKRFTQFVNERMLSALRPIDVVDKVTIIMEISTVVQKEEVRVKAEEYLEVVLKNVDSFNTELNRIVRASLPSCWDFGEVLIKWG